jgi:predicted transposase YbfD/YdcC
VNTENKLDRWAERELARNINDLIIQDAQGSVFAFGRYVIMADKNGAKVIKHGNDIAVFTNRATAMSWCVADQHNRINLARHVWSLDLSKRMLQQDLHARKAAAERSRDADFRERVLTKISSKQNQLDQVRAELAKLMSQAKYIQLQGSQHETSRTRRA